MHSVIQGSVPTSNSLRGTRWEDCVLECLLLVDTESEHIRRIMYQAVMYARETTRFGIVFVLNERYLVELHGPTERAPYFPYYITRYIERRTHMSLLCGRIYWKFRVLFVGLVRLTTGRNLTPKYSRSLLAHACSIYRIYSICVPFGPTVEKYLTTVSTNKGKTVIIYYNR